MDRSYEKQKAEADMTSAFQFQTFSLPVWLELESESKLNLPLAEERAVGCGDSAEGGVEYQRAAVQVIQRAVDAGNQQGVGQIEHFAQDFQVCFLLDIEAA